MHPKLLFKGPKTDVERKVETLAPPQGRALEEGKEQVHAKKD
jgi:hypothetical protein